MAEQSESFTAEEVEKRAKEILLELGNERKINAWPFFVLTTALSMLQHAMTLSKVPKFIEKEEKLKVN